MKNENAEQPDHIEDVLAMVDQPAQQEPCGWQFFQDGKWHSGMETNNHRANTEAAGIPVRDVYPSPQPAQQEPVAGLWYSAKEIDEMVRDLDLAMNGENAAPQAKLCDLMPTLIQRILDPQPPAQPLTDEQIEGLDCINALWDDGASCTIIGIIEFARKIEAAHGITKGGAA